MLQRCLRCARSRSLVMKFYFKLLGVFLLCVATFCLSVTYFARCDHNGGGTQLNPYNSVSIAGLDPDNPDTAPHAQPEVEGRGPDVTNDVIPCIINDDKLVSCRKEKDQVYVPFEFIKRYFEIYGGIEEKDGEEVLSWQHSYSVVYQPRVKYNPQGVFMSFEQYNVEIRDRVKCISGMEGVPLSTQWSAKGHYYPIQIAQYGLNHYSKYLVEDSRSSTLIEDAEESQDGGSGERWSVVGNKAHVTSVFDEETRSRVIQFDTSENWQDPGAKLTLKTTGEYHLSMDFKFTTNGSFSVYVQPKGKGPTTYCIRYVLSQTLIDIEGDSTIIIGIGERTRWSHITRDLAIDLMKGITLLYKKDNSIKLPVGVNGSNIKTMVLHKILSVVFRGHGAVDNITLSSSAHLAQFYYAANWLVLHQDSQGGWPVMVPRKLTRGMAELTPGWYSAMAQGQAISLLVRAYIRTANDKYLNSALKATALYSIHSSQGGVMTRFMNRYVWYEEYPTTPSSFVLNGFIYSLIGLYDLKTIAPSEKGAKASALFDDGMKSLYALLPLYDTGSGSIYDLRHQVLGVAPNLARWDYHATHINQLLLITTIVEEPDERKLYEYTAKRWIGYMKGRRASHN